MAVAVGLAAAGTAAVVALGERLFPVIPQQDEWFGADVARVVDVFTQRLSDAHVRSSVHPLGSLVGHPPTAALRLLGLGAADAVRVVVGMVAGLWLAAVYGLGRTLRASRPAALLISVLAAVSAPALFWLTVPENYGLGSLTLLIGFAYVAALGSRPVRDATLVVISALTLSITVTNWSLGLLIALRRLPWRRAVQVSANALVVVTLLWTLQKVVFPDSIFFLGDRREQNYVALTHEGHVPRLVTTFVVNVVVAPRAEIVEGSTELDIREGSPRAISAQLAPLLPVTTIGRVASVLWVALLALVAYALRRDRTPSHVVSVAVLFLAGQFALHLLYGAEPFLYVLHPLPAYLVLIGAATRTRWRRPVLALVAAVAVTAAVANVVELDRTTDLLRVLTGGAA